ncbi:MAG: helicase-exonuclease AddAB subunit AddA [Roseburia sp.]|nr:helicase-exonuclease AddAB subunit AddA [Roseburia sp.]MCM1278688.1 helicase-exonuclease AddAB subunit AddA [Robinsoniella sp.]
MGISFTKEQKQVIDERNKNLLVSAAAGSGKTAVLVERILSIITDKEHPADVDRLLIVTFTNAAASEMRERILKAILERLDKEPENEHLQRQSAYIHRAQITTIDSFCKYLLTNHFEDIGLDPSFRIGDQGELNLLKQDVLAELMEKEHERAAEGFLTLLESYVAGRNEGILEAYVLRLYEFAMSYPWPKSWLLQCKEAYLCESMEELKEKPFLKEMMNYVGRLCREAAFLLKLALDICGQSDGPYMYGELLEQEIQMLSELEKERDYELFHEKVWQVSFGRLSAKKDDTVLPEKREQAKELRNQAKGLIQQIKDSFFFVSPGQGFLDVKACSGNVNALIDLTLSFMELFSEKKREKNLMDFSDMEHYALEILLEEKEGKRVPTKTALAYQEYFVEVMTDEYQDSNLVQELLLESISKKEPGQCNRFMVGDVKQSIYGFRLARPELFMEKFQQYHESYVNHEKDNMRIDLHKNFRSRKEVIDSVNFIFGKLMDASMGGITYDDEAALYFGANYPEEDSSLYETELLLFERKESLALEENGEKAGEEEEILTSIPKKQAEAAMIGNRIKAMVGSFPVTDKETGMLRPAKYQDIVILLRSGESTQEIFKEELTNQGIPVHIASKSGYFSTMEVRYVLQYLQVLNNPYEDRALAGLLKSPFFFYTDEELAILKGFRGKEKKRDYLFECMKALVEEKSGEGLGQHIVEKDKAMRWEALQKKVSDTLKAIEENRKSAVALSIYELMAQIFSQSLYLEYVNALPGGEQKKANVEMLLEKAIEFEKTSFHGLFQFVRYIQRMEKYSIDSGEANILDERADTVRIMTIHKSKGLEFPICFVSGLSKRFNMQDIQSPVLLDMDWGIGTDMIDPKARVKAKTISKNMLAAKGKLDSLGEELRILYVALTRAKEKLILTGEVEKVQTLLQKYKGMERLEKLPFSFRSSVGNSLSYVLAALMGHKDFERICRVVHERDLELIRFGEDFQRHVLKERLLKDWQQEEINQALLEKLQEKFSYQYPHEILSRMYTKTSVSELKLEAMKEGGEELHSIFETERPPVPYLPGFLREEQEAGGTSRGSAYHKVLELLDYREYELEGRDGEEPEKAKKRLADKVKLDMEGFVQSGRLTKEYRELVRADKIASFVASSYGQKMCRAAKAGRLYKERPFVIGISAERVAPQFPKEEIVLIQGIIDVYFEEDGELVVLDYKTDRVEAIEELKRRYETQLNYYGEALCSLLKKPVKERVIYSFAMEEALVW